MRKTVSLLIVLVIIASNITTFSPVNAEPRTIIVPDDYSSIQTAVDNASPGDTVRVKSGIYYQNVTITKQLSLIGEGSETTIVYGFKSFNMFDPDITIQINADNVRISSFTIANCSVGINGNGNGIRLLSNVIDCYPTGIYFTGSNGTIANNTLTSSQYGRITIIGSNNIIYGNMITNGPLELEGSLNNMDKNTAERIILEKSASNTISRNKCGHLYSENSSHNNVFRNVIDGGGIRIRSSSDNVFSENYISNSTTGVSLESTISVSIKNRFYHNMFINNSERHVNSYENSNWSANFWDNGVEGNYYDDYKGVDNNRDGIGDSSYTIEETHYEESLGREVTVVYFQDNFPLMVPYDIENDKVVVPPPELFPTSPIVAAVMIAIVVAVGSGLLVYFKKRRRQTNFAEEG